MAHPMEINRHLEDNRHLEANHLMEISRHLEVSRHLEIHHHLEINHRLEANLPTTPHPIPFPFRQYGATLSFVKRLKGGVDHAWAA